MAAARAGAGVAAGAGHSSVAPAANVPTNPITAAPAGPVQQGLKEALFEALGSILSPVQEVRAAGEEQIKVLEVTEGERRGGIGGWGKVGRDEAVEE